MAYKKVVKRLKAGSNAAEDLAYLKSLKASDFASDGEFGDGTNGYNEVLEKWNALQKTPNKRRNFTWMEIQKGSKLAKMLANRYPENCGTKWAWIYHNKDKAEHKHYHFYLEFANPRSFLSVANELNIPVTNLQQVFDKKGILQYLTHENSPEKHHYSPDEVHSNFVVSEELLEPEIDPYQEFMDYCAMKSGKMPYNVWFERYKRYIVRHSFSARISMYDKICPDFERGELVPPFRVPCSNSPP